MDLGWHHWPLPKCFSCIQDSAGRDQKASKDLNLCLWRNIKFSSYRALEEPHPHTCTHQCDSLEEFTSSIALSWRHFWERVRFFFSIRGEKNGAELPEMMNRKMIGTTAHCSEQHFCHVSGSTQGLPQTGVPEKQGVSSERNVVDRFQPVMIIMMS